MFKDFTWSRFLGKVVIELLPKICASLIAGYLLMAQPWKTQAPSTAFAPPQSAESADASGAKPAQLIAEAHVSPLASPAARSSAAPEAAVQAAEAVPSPAPRPPLRRAVKERQYSAQANANATKVATASVRPQPQPIEPASVKTGGEALAAPPPSKPAATEASLTDKVLSVGDGALDLAKRGSARVLDAPVTAYQYGRDAVGKVTGAVASVLPFTR